MPVSGTSRSLGPGPSSRGEALFYIAFLLTLLLCWIMFATSLLEAPSCPSEAFASVHTLLATPFLLGLDFGPIGIGISFLCLGRRFVRYPGHLITFFGRNTARALPLAVGFLFIAGVCWFDLRRSYSCFDLNGVVAHHAFTADTVDGWTDLRVVTSGCVRNKGRPSILEMTLEFASGRTFTVIVTPAVIARLDDLRSALARASYLYRPYPSLNNLGCSITRNGRRFPELSRVDLSWH